MIRRSTQPGRGGWRDRGPTNVARPRSRAARSVSVAVVVSCFVGVGLLNTRPAAARPTVIVYAAAGEETSCGISSSGGLYCWGRNQFGQIGDGTTPNRLSPTAVFGLASNVTAVFPGRHTCAVVAGALVCWGKNSNGQLGDGTTTNRLTPTPVAGLGASVSDADSSAGHTCAISAGAAKCWGANASGQLGDGTTTDRLLPVAVSGLSSGVTAITTGDASSCAIRLGAAKCWGANSYGQLGDGSTTSRSTPVQVVGLTTKVTGIDSDVSHTCAVVLSAAMCWGDNGFGQLGRPASLGPNPTPAAISGLSSGVAAIDVGSGHSCAIALSTAKCWGRSSDGEVGVGTFDEVWSPASVVFPPGLTSGATRISAGSSSTCATTLPSLVSYCWGRNNYGQVGDNTTIVRALPTFVG